MPRVTGHECTCNITKREEKDPEAPEYGHLTAEKSFGCPTFLLHRGSPKCLFPYCSCQWPVLIISIHGRLSNKENMAIAIQIQGGSEPTAEGEAKIQDTSDRPVFTSRLVSCRLVNAAGSGSQTSCGRSLCRVPPGHGQARPRHMHLSSLPCGGGRPESQV